MEVVNVSLPFYGKSGTISRIITSEEQCCYFKFLYDVNGKEKDKSPLPVSRKKVKELKCDYYQDMLGYLRANQAKVDTYQNTRLKKKINLKNLYMDLFVSGLIACLGLGLTVASLQIAAASWTTVVSMLIFAISGTYCGTKILDKYFYHKDMKKAKFIQQYKNYQSELSEYRMVQENKHTPTKYHGLVVENNKGNTMKKTKILEK